jgi:predicted RNA-binding Zn-ribbon protein involved in translation (DUF1610 family)
MSEMRGEISALQFIVKDSMENNNSVSGFVCEKCGSDDIIRYKSKNKNYAICNECGSKKIVPICPICSSSKIESDRKRAEVVCKGCGEVLSCPPHYVGGRILVRSGWGYNADPFYK